MKATKYIVMGLAAMMFAGCTDFYDTNSPSTLDKKAVFCNEERTEMAI